MSEKSSQLYLETESIPKLMQKYCIPCVISLLTAALYNIVDQVFIANAADLGSFGNAANTAVYPLTVAALAIAVMIGDGACAYVSIQMGTGRRDSADHAVGNAIVLSLVSSLVLMTAYLIWQTPILSLFGADVNAETMDMAKQYFLVITLGLPFYMYGQAMNPIIRSDGSPKYAMSATLCGAIVNLILDPLFLYVFRWGMTGAAAATIIGQILTAVLSARYLMRPEQIELNASCFRLDGRLIQKFIPLGICSFLSQISLVFSMAATNRMIQTYSLLDPVFSSPQLTQIPLAVIGIVMKFFQVVISISIGTAAGIIPIVGYSIGAGRKDRALKLLSGLMKAEAVTGLAALVIAECFSNQLISIFGSANESAYYTQFALRAFRIYLCMIIPACINKASFIYLQALGKALLSTVLSLVREIVFGIGFVCLLPHFFGLDGILYAMPVSDILTFVISLISILWAMHFLSQKTQTEAV